MEPPPQILKVPPIGQPSDLRFLRRATIFSIVLPFVSLFLVLLIPVLIQRARLMPIALGLIEILPISALVLGVLSLRAALRLGRRGFFALSVVGTFINSGLVLLVLITIPAFQAIAEHRSSAEARRNLTLSQARLGFQTSLTVRQALGVPAPVPPPNRFRFVKYPSPEGQMAAYISPSPRDGRKHPAIIWLFGGFGNSIGETAWQPGESDNDQSGSAFWKAGLLLMYPSFRGGNDNPGSVEGFYGEVDDVIAAADYLSKQDYIDPARIYLGGHSTGGTLALLTAECSERFRAVFAFGPVRNVAGYGAERLPFDIHKEGEVELRSPGFWLHSVRTPTFVFEGREQPGNLRELLAMENSNTNTFLHFYPVKGATHFSILAPVSKCIARKILMDDGQSEITFSENELREGMTAGASTQ